MKTTFTPIAALLIFLSISATPAYAAVVGRVLVSAGDSVAIRNGQEVRLHHGSQIEDKDTLRTSAAGSLQVRFTDRSIVALREKSTFKLEQYAFSKETGGVQTAVFNLIKGGFRTITGLIGKSNQKSYSVKTAAATIGIRGTHYALRICEDDCKNPDGSNAKDGVYGSVLSASDKDSHITVNNETGEKEFGRDEHFYVKDEKAAPQTLLVPPSFVADNLRGRGQIAEKNTHDDGKDVDRKSGTHKDSRPDMIARIFESKVAVTDPNCITGDCRNLPPPPLERDHIVVTGKAVLTAYAGSKGAATYSVADNDAIRLTIERTLDGGGNLIAYKTVFGDSASAAGGTVIAAAAGAVIAAEPAGDHFGRWDGGSITGNSLADASSLPAPPLTPASGVHYLYTAALTLPEVIAARTGTVNFNHAGGTNPTDHTGGVGTFNSGNLDVNFTNHTAAMNANWSVTPVGGTAVTYALNGTPLILVVDGGGVNIGASLADPAGSFCTACSDSIIDQVNIQGNFSGAAGNTINMAISTFDAGAAAAAAPVTSASVQVFQEGLPPVPQ